ncbi:chorismate-binding protein [Candidatus Carsonella ruddii]|uniref:Anthranilate/para-aminobenzoate synthases component I n=1 Tax=Candidatus Carsonella ruddii HC isolate Thao2000 TaxID=1202538 RepID=J3TE75_CARRU|nr:chorismate-binding protein [Candidatus Carsonella ruddii]AFP83897.1 Anthranilate/para-aminobenzoate synthases component I [Candidatus Carsonella ruddii HC isolate Thao2000]
MIFHKFKKFLLFKKNKFYSFVKNFINKNYILLKQKNILFIFNFIINIKNNFFIKFNNNNILSKNIFFYLKKKIFKNKKKYRFIFSFFDYINFNFFQNKKIEYNFFFIPNFFFFFKKKNNIIIIFKIIKKKKDLIIFSKYLNYIIIKINNIYIINLIIKKNILNNFFIKKNIFFKNICKIKKNIKNGNLTQCVISNKIFIKNYFKNLNIIFSKYNLYLNLKETKIEIYSPEFLIKSENNNNYTKPIAGTTDKNHINYLIYKNKKEISEHIMLLDLSLNDLFKNNIKKIFLKRLIFCEYHKNLIHIVSELFFINYNKNKFNIIKNMFPAGTLSGSPKKNCIKLIKKLEKKNRNIYGGIFYYMNKNNLESSILIRIIFLYKNNKIIQSGVGVIDKSVNYLEWLESILKKQILIK